jgi:glycosyltransferase involved in cell wall biosynthesis
VATIHDLGYLYYPEAHTLSQNLYLRWSTRFNATSACRVLADSRSTRDDLVLHLQVPADKITVVYPGRDESLSRETRPELLASTRTRYGITGPFLLYIGTLHPRKNLVRLVEAFGQLLGCLSNAQPDAPFESDGQGGPHPFDKLQLVLAGRKGWLYDEVLARIRRLGLEGRVILPGFIAESDLSALLSAASVFVFPSLYEGFGFPVLEAMSCGVPVVCSNSSSLPEVAGEGALLVDPEDVNALASAMLKALNDSACRRSLVEAGYQQIRRFSWQRCAEETMKALEEAGRGIH